MWWIILALFSNGDTGAAVIPVPMTLEGCEQVIENTKKADPDLILVAKCIPRMEDI